MAFLHRARQDAPARSKGKLGMFHRKTSVQHSSGASARGGERSETAPNQKKRKQSAGINRSSPNTSRAVSPGLQRASTEAISAQRGSRAITEPRNPLHFTGLRETLVQHHHRRAAKALTRPNYFEKPTGKVLVIPLPFAKRNERGEIRCIKIAVKISSKAAICAFRHIHKEGEDEHPYELAGLDGTTLLKLISHSGKILPEPLDTVWQRILHLAFNHVAFDRVPPKEDPKTASFYVLLCKGHLFGIFENRAGKHPRAAAEDFQSFPENSSDEDGGSSSPVRISRPKSAARSMAAADGPGLTRAKRQKLLAEKHPAHKKPGVNDGQALCRWFVWHLSGAERPLYVMPQSWKQALRQADRELSDEVRSIQQERLAEVPLSHKDKLWLLDFIL